MTLKIERNSDGRRTVIRLIFGASSIGTSRGIEETDGRQRPPIGFDMECVTLVDLEVVRFLNACEKSGIELIHCSPYIREWMGCEQDRRDKARKFRLQKSTYAHKARKEKGNYNESS